VNVPQPPPRASLPTPLNNRGINFMVTEGMIEYYKADYQTYINKAFRGNVDVYKIVSDSAVRRSENPIELVKVKNKKALTQFYAKGKQPLADLFGLKALQVKALGDEVEKDDVLTLLNKPNSYQSGNDFEQMCSIWYDLLGEVVIWGQRLDELSDNGKPVALHVIPPFDIAEVSDGTMQGVKEYRIVSLNQVIRKEDCLMICRPNAKTSQMYFPTRGMSPLEAGRTVLQRSNEADQAAVDLLQTKGAVGAVYIDDQNVYTDDEPGQSGEKDSMQAHESNFVKKMYGKFAKNRIFFSNAKLGYVQFGRTSVEIGVGEHDKVATSKLCRLFNYPEILLTGDIKYENLKSASKLLIVSNIMPYQTMLAEALSGWLLPKFGKNTNNFALVFDPLYYSEIQEDIKDIGAVLESVTFLTINEKRAFLSYEPLTDELADKLLVKQGLMLLDDLTLANQVLPNVDYSNNPDPNSVPNLTPNP
jgi:HK97 family phage portal protein